MSSPHCERIDQDHCSEEAFRNERETAKTALRREYGLKKILGRSKAIKDLREKINRISSCDVNVLITGESGTGKELAARAIHYLSRRADKPFIPVNCGAIPENLFENELFGHVKGAFTDARFPQTGLVREAEGGTLFLDEISAITPYIQAKFLRLLQNNEYKPLGSSRPRKADIRIIAATNQDLLQLKKNGCFREDLYYRLDIVSVHIQPLRERKEDIPILVDHFLRQYCHEYNKPVKKISDNALYTLIAHTWPGNVREMENNMQKLVVMCPHSEICTTDVHYINNDTNEIREEKSELEYFQEAKQKIIDQFEKTYLTQLLTKFRGNVVRSAEAAGKSRTALWNLLKRHKLSPKEFRL